MSSSRNLLRASAAVAAAAFSVFAIVACQPEDEAAEAGDSAITETLVCASKPQARSYVGFNGAKLEDTRADEAVDVNRARFKPFAVMAGEYQRVLGVTPKGLASAAATFDDPPARWHAEAALSGVSLTSVHALGLEACTASMATNPERSKAPTQDTATKFCTDTMLSAWGAAPEASEVASCVDLAMKKLAIETDPKKRWAHVCASILASSQFLTF